MPDTTPTPEQAAALARLTAECRQGLDELAALAALEGAAVDAGVHTDTLRRAVREALVTRLARVLDVSEDPRVRSYAWVRRTWPAAADRLAATPGRAAEPTQDPALRDLAQRLSAVRNKALAHLDAAAVDDPRTPWEQAGLTPAEAGHALRTVLAVVEGLAGEDASASQQPR